MPLVRLRDSILTICSQDRRCKERVIRGGYIYECRHRHNELLDAYRRGDRKRKPAFSLPTQLQCPRHLNQLLRCTPKHVQLLCRYNMCQKDSSVSLVLSARFASSCYSSYILWFRLIVGVFTRMIAWMVCGTGDFAFGIGLTLIPLDMISVTGMYSSTVMKQCVPCLAINMCPVPLHASGRL